MEAERQRILQMLEERKITSAEADALMDALRDSASTRSASSHGADDSGNQPGELGLPVIWVARAARWLAAVVVSVAFAVRWLLAWWRGPGPARRRHR